MLRRTFAVLLAVSLASLFAGSGGDSTEPKPTIPGTWTGTITTGGTSGTMSLALQQAGTQVTGNGSMTGQSGSAALTATASFTAPSFSLTLSATGFESINYAGSVNGKSMSGTLNGSRFVNVPVTLTRQ